MEIIFGYIGALLTGTILGLMGGGGSILTIPILVYILSIDVTLATAYSLFIVGAAALVGAFRNMQKGMIDFKTGFIFAIPTVISIFFTRKFLMPAIPNELFVIGNFSITKHIAIMVLFAVVMVFAAFSMIKGRKESIQTIKTTNYTLMFLQGIFIGVITGLVGAGGGFLIIPALVLLAKLPMKKAVATSLMIIAINSLIGFTGDIQHAVIDWSFLIIFTSIAILGIFIGIYLNNYIDGKKLKKTFGWFVLIMGVYIIIHEIKA